MSAMNLVSWIHPAVLPSGHAAGVWDIKRWRYRLYSIAGKLISSAHRNRVLIPEAAAEAGLFTALIDGTERLRQRWRNAHLTA